MEPSDEQKAGMTDIMQVARWATMPNCLIRSLTAALGIEAPWEDIHPRMIAVMQPDSFKDLTVNGAALTPMQLSSLQIWYQTCRVLVGLPRAAPQSDAPHLWSMQDFSNQLTPFIVASIRGIAQCEAPSSHTERPGAATSGAAQETKRRRVDHGLITHYDILGIPMCASVLEVREAYKRQALLHHPDKHDSSEKFMAVQKAYEVLSDMDSRTQYDMSLPAGSAGEKLVKTEKSEVEEHQSHLLAAREACMQLDGTSEQEMIEFVACVPGYVLSEIVSWATYVTKQGKAHPPAERVIVGLDQRKKNYKHITALGQNFQVRMTVNSVRVSSATGSLQNCFRWEIAMREVQAHAQRRIAKACGNATPDPITKEDLVHGLQLEPDMILSFCCQRQFGSGRGRHKITFTTRDLKVAVRGVRCLLEAGDAQAARACVVKFTAEAKAAAQATHKQLLRIQDVAVGELERRKSTRLSPSAQLLQLAARTVIIDVVSLDCLVPAQAAFRALVCLLGLGASTRMSLCSKGLLNAYSLGAPSFFEQVAIADLEPQLVRGVSRTVSRIRTRQLVDFFKTSTHKQFVRHLDLRDAPYQLMVDADFRQALKQMNRVRNIVVAASLPQESSGKSLLKDLFNTFPFEATSGVSDGKGGIKFKRNRAAGEKTGFQQTKKSTKSRRKTT